jgi:hypothetical protein
MFGEQDCGRGARGGGGFDLRVLGSTFLELHIIIGALPGNLGLNVEALKIGEIALGKRSMDGARSEQEMVSTTLEEKDLGRGIEGRGLDSEVGYGRAGVGGFGTNVGSLTACAMEPKSCEFLVSK